MDSNDETFPFKILFAYTNSPFPGIKTRKVRRRTERCDHPALDVSLTSSAIYNPECVGHIQETKTRYPHVS